MRGEQDWPIRRQSASAEKTPLLESNNPAYAMRAQFMLRARAPGMLSLLEAAEDGAIAGIIARGAFSALSQLERIRARPSNLWRSHRHQIVVRLQVSVPSCGGATASTGSNRCVKACRVPSSRKTIGKTKLPIISSLLTLPNLV